MLQEVRIMCGGERDRCTIHDTSPCRQLLHVTVSLLMLNALKCPWISTNKNKLTSSSFSYFWVDVCIYFGNNYVIWCEKNHVTV